MGCSVMILTGTAGGIITPALVGQMAEWAGIQSGMGVVAVVSALLLASVILSTVSEKRSEHVPR